MKTVTISEFEYQNLQQTISDLKQKLSLYQDSEFVNKLNLAYQVLVAKKPILPQDDSSVSIKRGSGKHLISYMADDFTESLPEFQDYM